MALQEARDLATTELHSTFGLRRRRPRAAATTEFGAALDILDITQAHAGRLFQVSQRHVRRWKRADRSVPVGVATVLRLLTQGAVSLAQVELAATSISAWTNGGAEGEPLVSLEEAPDPAKTATLAEKVYALAPGTCRWPLGDPQRPNFCFCGHPAVAQPYCARHRTVAYLALRTGRGHGVRVGFVAHGRQPHPQQAPAHGSPSAPSAFSATGVSRPPKILADLASDLPGSAQPPFDAPPACAARMC